MKRIQEKAADNWNNRGVTIAFLGDSVTQGCFEIYKDNNGEIVPIFDKESAYHNYLNQIMSLLYPSVPITIVNAGISGDRASHGYERLEKDILPFSPDLVVVCFGLNDSTLGLENIHSYGESLRRIFRKLQKNSIEVIFMTPNMMNTYVSEFLTDQDMRSIAKAAMLCQNEGIMDKYMKEAALVCEECKVPMSDCYAKWKKLAANGVDITRLLSNKINHPSREMNWIFAVSLLETMMQ